MLEEQMTIHWWIPPSRQSTFLIWLANREIKAAYLYILPFSWVYEVEFANEDLLALYRTAASQYLTKYGSVIQMITFQNMHAATMDQMKMIGKLCRNLKVFSGDTDDGVYPDYKNKSMCDTSLLELQNCHYLEKVIMERITHNFTAVAFISCIKAWPNLLHLDLKWSTPLLTDATLEELGRSHRKLVSLTSSMERVTHKGLRALAACNKLEHLDIYDIIDGTDRLASAAIMDTIAQLPELGTFFLCKTKNLDLNGILSTICSSCPKLTKLLLEDGVFGYEYLLDVVVSALPNLLFLFTLDYSRSNLSEVESEAKVELESIFRERGDSSTSSYDDSIDSYDDTSN